MQSSTAIKAAAWLRDTGPAGITALARDLKLSRTSVENALAVLQRHELIIEVPGRSHGAGRPARHYAFHAAGGLVAGVDIGVHSLRVVVADLAGTTLVASTTDGVDPTLDPATQLDTVIGQLGEAISGLDPGRLRAIGISLPGIIDRFGNVVASVIFPAWAGVDMVGELRARFGCPVIMDNGVRLATVAEHHMGSGRRFDDVLYLSVGTRIAAGMILGGHPRRGAHNVAGDIGRVAFRGLNERTGQIRWRNGRTAKEVFALARQQDAHARKELREFINELARGVATVVMAIDPAIVIIGGGMSLADEELLEPLREAMARHIGLPLGLPVIASRLGDEAAVHGALVFAFDQCAEHIYRVGALPPPTITPMVGKTAR